MYYSIIRDIRIIWDCPFNQKIDRTVAFSDLVDNGCIKTDMPLQIGQSIAFGDRTFKISDILTFTEEISNKTFISHGTHLILEPETFYVNYMKYIKEFRNDYPSTIDEWMHRIILLDKK